MEFYVKILFCKYNSELGCDFVSFSLNIVVEI